MSPIRRDARFPPEAGRIGCWLPENWTRWEENRDRAGRWAAEKWSAVRALPDNFLWVGQSIIVEKGDREKLALANRFIEEVRTSGYVKTALDRAQLRGTDVAPPPSR